jgi:Na+/serine symporter
MESMERTSVSLVPESPANPIWVAFVMGLLALALALGYALAHAVETRWVFMQ